VVVDAEVDDDVREAGVALLGPDHEDRRRLLAAKVSPGGLSCVEAVEQAFDEWLSRGRLEGLGERVDGLGRDQDVPLRCIP
jgi:hypothetical protein